MKVNIIKTERILSPTQIPIADFTINPYRGCPFGCIYCYAQVNKTIKRRNEKWGTFIDVKINALELLKKELKNKNIKRVLLGSTVECYPPQEKKFCLTQKIIELLNQHNIAVTILTKSFLLRRDLDLIAKFKNNKIFLTINFNDEKTKKLFEAKTSSLISRWSLLRQIQKRKIPLCLYIAPYFPNLQDIEILIKVAKNLEEVAVEIYNPLMGNWNAVKNILKTNFSPETFERINKIFSDEITYKEFLRSLSEELDKLSKIYNYKISLVAPGFNSFYTNRMPYL